MIFQRTFWTRNFPRILIFYITLIKNSWFVDGFYIRSDRIHSFSRQSFENRINPIKNLQKKKQRTFFLEFADFAIRKSTQSTTGKKNDLLLSIIRLVEELQLQPMRCSSFSFTWDARCMQFIHFQRLDSSLARKALKRKNALFWFDSAAKFR